MLCVLNVVLQWTIDLPELVRGATPDLLSSEDEDHNSKAKHSIQYDESPAAPRSFMPGVRVYYSDESEHSLSSSPSSSSAAPSGRRL
jgi:hypothetical protein